MRPVMEFITVIQWHAVDKDLVCQTDYVFATIIFLEFNARKPRAASEYFLRIPKCVMAVDIVISRKYANVMMMFTIVVDIA